MKKEGREGNEARQTNAKWLWYVMRCCESSETRGANQRGAPCGEWGILRRLKPVDWTRPQVRCPQKGCAHRPRVNPAIVVGPLDSKGHAEHVLSIKRRDA